MQRWLFRLCRRGRILTLFTACAVCAPFSGALAVQISEFLAANDGSLFDADGDASDWIELRNDSSLPVSLLGWYLSDDAANLTRWRLPDVTLAPGEYLVVFASGKDRREPSGELHASFKLDADGEYLALVEPDGSTVASAFDPFPRQVVDVSFGRAAGDATRLLFFDRPSPGAANSPGAGRLSAEPVFSHEAGVFTRSFDVELSSPDAGATIHYTIDGGEPDTDSPRYDGALRISRTSVVRAKAFTMGFLPSPVVERSFVFVTGGVAGFRSSLPLALVDTAGRRVSSGSDTAAHLHLVERDATGRSSLESTPDFSGAVAIKIRGSSTAGREKASFAVEVQDAFGEDRDVELLGLPAESDWILYGPYNFDRAMVRNALIYELSNQIGRYAVRTRFVEAFVNTDGGAVSDADYFGVYALMEKIKRSDDRVDIEPLAPSDNRAPAVEGGYIVKIDRRDPGDAGFNAGGQTLAFVEPKEDEISSAQRAYIAGYINDFVAALNSGNFADPVEGYAPYIDRLAWIDHHILNVLAKNVDALRLSTYMYKPRDGRLAMGPIWDFDRSMDSSDGRDDSPTTWNGTGDATQFFSYPWWGRLFQDPDFWQLYRDRWHELRQGPLSEANVHAVVDAMADELREAQARNFDRWPLSLNGGWQGEIDRLKTWLSRRLEWIDGNFPGVPRFDPPSSVIEPGTVVRMSAPTGTILYTLDGSDPRIPGGAVSPSALEFGSSATATLLSPESHSGVRALVPTGGQLGTTWTQPGFDDRGWRLATGGIGVGYERGFGYELSIDLDVEVEMFERATSVYARMEFEVEAPELYRFLYLDLQYDDGFVAYLNGRRVASNNAPAAPSWNSQSTAQNPDEAALSFETFDISAHAGELRAGRNVLALHGFNTNTTSSDLLIRPRLRASGAFTGDALPLDGYAAIRARTRIGDDWSALGEATYLSDDGRDVRVSELHYHPRRPAPPSQVSEEDFEFLEIENIGPAAVDLRGLRLTRGIDFDFAESDVVFLAPGARALVVSDLDAFRSRYGAGGIAVAGEYSGQLANGGERVRLENALGESLIDFDYDDGWYPETDGGGHSLVVVDTAGDPERLSEKPSWRPSAAPDGTPGAAEDGSGEGGGQVPGDANQDGFLDIADAISLLSHLFGDRNQPTPCGGSLLEGSNRVLVDYNGDGGIDLTDAIGLLRFLHLGGQPHHRGTGCIALPGCASVCD